ncbi:sensor histidine kinase [Faecalicatena contorta]|uniref:histidine kinase n=1 Tax=Faecalicatena contorta TaxID=39482 RepID=A0A315ZTN2_9FIRM|nr:HAMP domain-containing sensor histidine kinase [Faecalicatena contorta]PWJ48238.1 signal transduction histidine kinase [Faecalicatena contorta]SUQ15514.1 Signal transduction histidine kinase [Faecalicatena contorta]
MEVKQKITLQSVFWRFLFWFCAIAGGNIFICLVVFLLLSSMGMVLPANYGENMLEENRDKIENVRIVSEELIPEGCRYGVFSTDGGFLYGNIGLKMQKEVWEEYEQDGRGNSRIGYLKYFRREGEVCIAAYRLKAEFTNPVLKKWLPGAPETFLILLLVMFLIEVVLLIRRFGRIIGKELETVKLVTEKVRLQDLDFERPDTRIREVDEVMESLAGMREALESSLKSQWKMEEIRKQQIRALVHDIKTPLTVIRGNAQLMQESESAEESREYEDYILQETDRIEEYINTLQKMLQSEETVQFQREKVDVRQTAEAFAVRAKMLAAGNQQNLDVVIFSTTAYINSDRQLLLRAWENLLSNALEYTPAGGDILISIKMQGKKLVFMIEDSGPGFTEEDMCRGTEQFYQGDKSRNSRSHYGMGLFMVSSFIKQQGGDMILGNSPRTKGALVRLEINI